MTRPKAHPTVLRAPWALAVLLVALLAGACGSPGSSGDEGSTGGSTSKPVSTDVAAAGDVTLTVWDQEVRGGQAPVIKQLNREFQERYPNVTIKRTAKSFTDLNTTLKLAVSGPNPPDVVQANQGWGVMGPLVKGGLLQPLDPWADQYGWRDRFPEGQLRINSFSPDGTTFGGSSLYGLSQTGEAVGAYYNKQKLRKLGLAVPKTFAEFEAALAKAKANGETPIMFGNKEGWPGIHEFEAVQSQQTSRDYIRNLVFGQNGASFADPQDVKAAATFKRWADKGYLSKGFNGLSYDDAWPEFAKGKGVFLITGTWLNTDLSKTMGKNVGFFLVPPTEDGGSVVALGGIGLPFAITSKAKNPDVAAAYVDFLTNEHASEVVVDNASLPAVVPDTAKPAPGTVLADVFSSWRSLNDADGIVPYLDYSTPTFYDTITAAVQELGGGRATPKQFVDKLQADYEKFLAK